MVHGNFHGIARQQHPIYAETALFLRWNGWGNLCEQMGVGFDTALQISFHLGLLGEMLAFLPGNLTPRTSIVWFSRRVVGEIPGQVIRMDNGFLFRTAPAGILVDVLGKLVDHVADLMPIILPLHPFV